MQARASENGATSNGASSNGVVDKEYDYDLFTIGAGSGGVRGTRFASQNYGKHWVAAALQGVPCCRR